MPSTDEILSRVDSVLKENRKTEWIYIGLTAILFLSGIGCLISAIVTRAYVWATPSMVTTWLLRWPLQEIKDIRKKNIALATAPMLITQLPSDKAAEEIQKLLGVLYAER